MCCFVCICDLWKAIVLSCSSVLGLPRVHLNWRARDAGSKTWLGSGARRRHDSVAHSLVSLASASPSLAAAFLACSLSFSSLISLNFLMFSKKLGLLCRVMKSLAFLLSPFYPCTVMVLVLISLKVAYSFLWKYNRKRYCDELRFKIKKEDVKCTCAVQRYQANENTCESINFHFSIIFKQNWSQ